MCYPSSDPFSSTVSAESLPSSPWTSDAQLAEPEMTVAAITGVIRPCICSPTSHPGSFRCRQHHGQYKWATAACRH